MGVGECETIHSGTITIIKEGFMVVSVSLPRCVWVAAVVLVLMRRRMMMIVGKLRQE
jgi:hypothetical protein